MAWEHFRHGAHIGVRGIGATRDEAFREAATALTAVVTDPRRVASRIAIEVRCAGSDDDLLLVDWLNALIRAMSTYRVLFGRFAVRLGERSLAATAWGEAVEGRHAPAVEVKGATSAGLAVGRRDDGRWTAQCVVEV